MVTIYTIAKECGFAPATVCRALNNSSSVKQETRDIIINTAKKLGYYPNSTARNLVTKKSWNVGVLMYDGDGKIDELGLMHNFFAKILNSFKKEMERNGYDITFVSSELKYAKKSYLVHCKSKQLDGVFLVCADYEQENIKELLNSDLPIVCFDYIHEGTSCITIKNDAAMKELTQFFIDNGHKDMLYLMGKSSFPTEERLKGFKKALKENNIEFKPEMVVKSKFNSIENGYYITNEILKRDKLPSALLYPDDYTALGGMKAIKEKGLKIPDDISISGFDGILISEYSCPKMTTIRQNSDEIGKSASKILLDLIDNKNLEKGSTYYAGYALIEGESCKKIN